MLPTTLAAVALALLAGPVVAADQIVLAVNFSDAPLGTYTADAFLADWHVAPRESAGLTDDRLAIVVDPLETTRHVLRVTYRAGRIGGGSAMTFNVPLAGYHDDLWLQYRLMFPDDFTWVKGGKLPGFGGGDTPTGCIADGGFDGFTTRLMWREGGQAFSYLYFPGKVARCGDYAPLYVQFQKGRWHTVVQHVRLNDPGQANGTLEQYVDGVKVLALTQQTWRLQAKVSIDSIKMDTFFGGSTPNWAPLTDQFLYLGAFRVWSGGAPVEATASSSR